MIVALQAGLKTRLYVSNIKSAAIVAALFLFASACSTAPSVNAGPPRILLDTATERATIDVVDLPAEQLRELAGEKTRDQWVAVLRVAVGADQAPMVGEYAVVDGRLRFTPMFPLDPGRAYEVRYVPPGEMAPQPLVATVSLPARDTTPITVVSQVFPTAGDVPENQLRLYVHFSAPMGSKGGLDYIHLLDDKGVEVKDPFLPLDAEFWNDDRTRYTVFFDPGRQKRGIAPIADMGRSLTQGKSYTLVIDAEWRDGNGLPLKEPFRRTFRVGPPDEKPLDPKGWTVTAPAAGATNSLRVVFPEPLDHGLLLRALGVLGPNGQPLPGDAHVSQGELTWSFTPKGAWQAGQYNLVALAMLEDLAGNRIGRAFEVDQFDRSDRTPEPEKTLIPFVVR
jgi:hypothetical protein